MVCMFFFFYDFGPMFRILVLESLCERHFDPEGKKHALGDAEEGNEGTKKAKTASVSALVFALVYLPGFRTTFLVGSHSSIHSRFSARCRWQLEFAFIRYCCRLGGCRGG